jgi:hypothetical protein
MVHWYSLSVLVATTKSATYEAVLSKNHKVLVAHAVLGSIVFGLLAPLGAIVIRLKFPRLNLVKLHAFWQLVVWAIYTAAFSLGIWLRWSIGSAHLIAKWMDPHAIIGYILVGMLTLQPVLGYIHHLIFKSRFLAVQAGEPHAKAPGRTLITHGHLWLGRVLIPLGIINGALGIKATWSPMNPLQSAHTSNIAMIVYCVLVGAVYVLYLAICIRHEYRRTMDVVAREEGEPAAEEVARMPKSRRQSLETGKEILRIAEAQNNVHDDEIPLTEVSEKRQEERDVSEESLPGKI